MGLMVYSAENIPAMEIIGDLKVFSKIYSRNSDRNHIVGSMKSTTNNHELFGNIKMCIDSKILKGLKGQGRDLWKVVEKRSDRKVVEYVQNFEYYRDGIDLNERSSAHVKHICDGLLNID
jgi:hypothetical protein